MKKISLGKLTLLFALLLMAFPTFAYDCWENEDGITECGDSIPPQYSQKGFAEYDAKGSKVKDVNRALNPEEIAEIERKKEEERQRQEQLKKDQQLLSIFSSEEDIERARTAELSSIEGQVQSIKTILEGLRGNLISQKESLQRSKEAEVPETQLNTIQRIIDGIKKRIKNQEDTLQNKAIEQDEINIKYDTYLESFQNIQKRSGVPVSDDGGKTLQ